MYSKQQASLINQSFWTAFGRYMAPVPAADGSKINWINYKTGVKNLYLRMQVTNKSAAIAIVVTNMEEISSQKNFEKLTRVLPVFSEILGEVWEVNNGIIDEHANKISAVSKTIYDVNVLDDSTWPAIISFLKPRLIAWDAFWYDAKDLFD